jgi:hypothetical protein
MEGEIKLIEHKNIMFTEGFFIPSQGGSTRWIKEFVKLTHNFCAVSSLPTPYSPPNQPAGNLH